MSCNTQINTISIRASVPNATGSLRRKRAANVSMIITRPSSLKSKNARGASKRWLKGQNIVNRGATRAITRMLPVAFDLDKIIIEIKLIRKQSMNKTINKYCLINKCLT